MYPQMAHSPHTVCSNDSTMWNVKVYLQKLLLSIISLLDMFFMTYLNIF